MAYPPAPWHLYGTAFQTLHLVDLARSRAIVPAEFEIVAVLPGKTLGGLYLSTYDGGSTLTYHELIVVPGLVRYGNQVGTWVSHIYVDDPASVAGGRNIWGLPKELAEFIWGDRSISVHQASTSLCELEYTPRGLPLSLWGQSSMGSYVFSGLDQDILLFEGKFEAGLKWIQGSITIPIESPFASLKFGRSWLTIQLSQLHLTAAAPTIAGQWQPESSRSSI